MPTTGVPARTSSRSASSTECEVALGDVEEAVVVERATAAQVPLGHHDLPARRLDGLHASHAHIGVEVVVERVGEEHHGGPVRVGGAPALLEPLLQRHRGEPWDRAVLGDPAHPSHQVSGAGQVGHGVGDLGDAAGEPGCLVDEPHGIGRARPPAPQRLVVVVEELRLVGRHVDVDGTVVRAALARQAQVEGFSHLRGLPAVGDDLALQHLEQQSRPTARAVLLLAGDHVAGAHDLLGLRHSALPDSDAPQGGVGEVVSVLCERERGVGSRWVVVDAEPEVLVERVCVHDLPGAHQPPRVPDRLELTHRADEIGAVLLLEELGTLLAVAVLPGQRPAEGGHQVGGLLHEPSVVGDPRRGA